MPPALSLREPGPARWLAVAGLIVTAVGTAGSVHRDASPAAAAVAAVLAAGAVAPVLTRPHPTTVAFGLLSSGLLTGAYFVAGYADGPVFLALPAVAFAAAAATSPRLWLWTPVATVLAVAGLVAREALHRAERPATWQGIGLAALVAAAAATGAAVSARRVAATERAHRAASQEQLRMAADLHDGVGHGLAVIAMQAGAALHVLDRDRMTARTNLEAIRETSRDSLELLRGHLSEMAGDGSTAPRSPVLGLADLPALVARVRAAGLDVRVEGDVTSGRTVDPAVGRAAYAVVQEGLTNVLRHAAATRATVHVEWSTDELVVTVSDDGRARAIPGTTEGRGIAGLRTRVEDLGGTVVAEPGPTGFLVRATVPLEVRRG